MFSEKGLMKTKLFLLICFFSLPLYSQTQTFVREYTYTAGEADSKITSRAIALDQVKKILLEEIGVYLQSTFETTKVEKNNVLTELTKEQMQSITAGVTETKILEEKWNGETYYIKASITVNTQDVSNNIARIANDHGKLKELEEAKQRADSAEAVIDKLRTELAQEKNENEKLATQKEYSVASNSLSASDYFQRGYNAYEIKDLDNAILNYEQAIELAPNYIQAYNNLGVAYEHKGETAKAIPLYEKAIELNPQLSVAYNNLGNIYCVKGEIDKAISFFEKAVELDPKYSEAYNGLGNAYQEKGDIDKAIPQYEKAIELNPNYSEAYNDMGLAYYHQGNLDKAIPSIEKAIDLNPEDASAYFNLGLAYKKKGDLDKAIQYFEKAIQLDPTDPSTYINLGNAYEDNGDSDKKIECYRKAVD